MRHALSLIALLSLALFTLHTTPGCETVKETFSGSGEPNEDLQAVVEVEDPDYGGTTPITVTMSSTSYREAVGKLRTQKWGEAIEILNEKIEGESHRERRAEAYFAKGVAHEAQGDYAGALKAYESAFELQNKAEYEDAVNRARSGLQG